MSDAVWPDLPGLKWDRTKIAEWRVITQTAVSGKEKRLALWTYPRYTFKLGYEFLDQTQAKDDLQAVIGFFNSRQGNADNFLYLDPSDNTATNQIIGRGDGVTSSFKLVRAYGGYIEPVNGILVAPTVKVNDVATTAFTWDTNGFIDFAEPPASGATITASFSFYYRVRFTEEKIDFSNFLYQLWELKSVEFITDK